MGAETQGVPGVGVGSARRGVMRCGFGGECGVFSRSSGPLSCSVPVKCS